jgi:hypothetical protein
MKAILEFNLPEDNLEYLQVIKASDMATALWQITHNLKKQCMREAETNNESVESQYVIDGINLVYEKIYQILDDNNINVDEINN